MKDLIKPADISRASAGLCRIEPGDLAPLPPPYEDFNATVLKPLPADKVKALETSLDDTLAIGIPKPATPEEEEEQVRRFHSGLTKHI
jgi:hypothetical protein